MRVGVNDWQIKHNRPKGKPRNTKGRPTKAQVGQPTKYDPIFVQVAYESCLKLGAGLDNLAHMFKVSLPTIYNWMREHEDFYRAISLGRDEWANRHVEDALLRSANGYTITLKEQKVTKDGDVVDCKREHHVAPNPTAAIFWLCNRDRVRWQAVMAKMQQLNVFPSTYGAAVADGKNGNGNGKDQHGEGNGSVLNDPAGVRAVLEALRESGALATGLSLPGPKDDNGPDT